MGKFYRRKTLKTGQTMDEMLNQEEQTEHQKHELKFQEKTIKDQQKAIKEQQKAVEKWISDQFE